MRKIVLGIYMFSIALASCQNNENSDSKILSNTSQDSTELIDMHTSQVALDWNGVYEGTLPCADCPGIKATIELKDDNTFVEHLEYLDRDTEFSDTGKIEWHKNGNNITLISDNGGKQQYKVREGSLVMLNSDGQENTGIIAEHYVLNKKK